MQRFASHTWSKDSARPSVLFVDNFDSFSFNVVQLLANLGAEVDVISSNDPLPRRGDGSWTHLVLSPGPGTPADSGICQVLAANALAGNGWPLLGVCLGHQVICAAAGGKIVRASRLMHGKTSHLLHDGQGIFAGLEQNLDVMRYHSLIVEPSSLPASLICQAWTAQGEVMAVRHHHLPIWGVQFHPESIGSVGGDAIVAAFLRQSSDQSTNSSTIPHS